MPKGFTCIRHYGFLGSAARKKRLLIIAKLGELTFLREIAPIRLMRGPPRKKLVRS